MYVFVLVFVTELRKLLISSPYLTIPMETVNPYWVCFLQYVFPEVKPIGPSNRSFPISPPPPFQSEAKCEVCHENQFHSYLRLDPITIQKISHLDSL